MSLLFASLSSRAGIAATEDLNALFQDCAYVPAPASRTGETPAKALFRLWSAESGETPLAWDGHFHVGDSFRVEVTAPFDGYFYMFQDDPANPVLVIPRASESDNKLSASKARRFPSSRSTLKVGSAKPFQLMLLVSRQRIPGVERMTWEQLRQYARDRARCGIILLEEHAVTF
jgi:hypothetical protein